MISPTPINRMPQEIIANPYVRASIPESFAIPIPMTAPSSIIKKPNSFNKNAKCLLFRVQLFDSWTIPGSHSRILPSTLYRLHLYRPLLMECHKARQQPKPVGASFSRHSVHQRHSFAYSSSSTRPHFSHVAMFHTSIRKGNLNENSHTCLGVARLCHIYYMGVGLPHLPERSAAVP